VTVNLRAEAATARQAAAGRGDLGTPGEPQRSDLKFGTELRASKVEKDGLDWVRLEGYASVTERGYRMFDWFGEYSEVIDPGAFSKTLSASPMVVYRDNHNGTPMATTRNGRLELRVDSTGLEDIAHVNPKREDVQRLVTAIEDRDVTEQSFMFRIVDGVWSPDYTEYRITEVDLDRGDVGPVTYGANPHTSVEARSAELLRDLQRMSPGAARAALEVLAARADVSVPPALPAAESAPARGGRSVALVTALLG
jgi:HK97 family phage prohead protease